MRKLSQRLSSIFTTTTPRELSTIYSRNKNKVHGAALYVLGIRILSPTILQYCIVAWPTYRLPSSFCRRMTRAVSSSVQPPRFSVGSRTLSHLSRTCLEVRDVPWASATLIQRMPPRWSFRCRCSCSMILRRRWSSAAVHGAFFFFATDVAVAVFFFLVTLDELASFFLFFLVAAAPFDDEDLFVDIVVAVGLPLVIAASAAAVAAASASAAVTTPGSKRAISLREREVERLLGLEVVDEIMWRFKMGWKLENLVKNNKKQGRQGASEFLLRVFFVTPMMTVPIQRLHGAVSSSKIATL